MTLCTLDVVFMRKYRNSIRITFLKYFVDVLHENIINRLELAESASFLKYFKCVLYRNIVNRLELAENTSLVEFISFLQYNNQFRPEGTKL